MTETRTSRCQQPEAHGFEASPCGKPVNCDDTAHHKTPAPFIACGDEHERDVAYSYGDTGEMVTETVAECTKEAGHDGDHFDAAAGLFWPARTDA